jgi:hypothetical protein
MNWSHIRKVNRRASARKAKRERKAAEFGAMQDRLGGTVKVGELRAASREWRVCRGGYGPFDCEVWTFRGREWRIVHATDMETLLATVHEPWRQDPTMREMVYLTKGAQDWVKAQWAAEAAAAAKS